MSELKAAERVERIENVLRANGIDVDEHNVDGSKIDPERAERGAEAEAARPVTQAELDAQDADDATDGE